MQINIIWLPVIFLSGIILSSIFYFLLSRARNKQYEREISRIEKTVQDRDGVISGLLDRMMSQSLGEYKACIAPPAPVQDYEPIEDESIGVMDATVARKPVDE